MKKIGIIGAGHAFKNQYKAFEKLGYEIIICDKDIEKIIKYPNKKVINYRDLIGDVDMVLVSTPPSTHFEIIKYFLENNIFVLSEKPLVSSKLELNELTSLVNKNFYNIFHFAFGDEINWFLKSDLKLRKPYKIEAYINDPYVKNMHIKDEVVNLHGAYLDETINPLSALMRIFKSNIEYISSNLKTYDGDLYDYHAESNFIVDDIPTKVIVDWNDSGDKSKYIDLFYEDKTIRLDSMNSMVIDLTNNKVLYKSDDDRMFKHYINAINNFHELKTNEIFAFNLNKEILNYKL